MQEDPGPRPPTGMRVDEGRSKAKSHRDEPLFRTQPTGKPPTMMARAAFARMVTGADHKRPGTAIGYNRNRTYDQTLSESVIQDAADAMAGGGNLRVNIPTAVADVIDELNVRRVSALQGNEYQRAKRLRQATEATRFQFRQRERRIMHDDNVARLEKRSKDAVVALEQMKAKWKGLHAREAEERKQMKEAVMERQMQEHRDLESHWSSPETLRRFDKRSPVLLQQGRVEQYMLLLGNYDDADQMRRTGAATEAREREEREHELRARFEMARAHLIKKHEDELLRSERDEIENSCLRKEIERKEMDVCEKRVEATRREFENDKDYGRFIAKKFKRDCKTVVPATVLTSRDAGEDIPVSERGKAVTTWSADIQQVRQRDVVTRLPVRPPVIRAYKRPRPKKLDDEDDL